MTRTAKFLAAGLAAALVGTFGIGAPAGAVTVFQGCTVTNPAPHKSGNTVVDTFVLTCNVANTGDSAFLKLWRNNGDGTYNGWVSEVSRGSEFTQYNVTTTPHTCSTTASHVWHAEFYGDLQLPNGTDPAFTIVNSPDVTLACS